MQYVHIYNDARGLMMCPNMGIKMERLLHGDNQNIDKEHNKRRSGNMSASPFSIWTQTGRERDQDNVTGDRSAQNRNYL